MSVTKIETNDMDNLRPADSFTADRDSLKDIREVNVNAGLPKEERMMDFISQIGCPYCYRHGDYVVKTSFVDTDVTLEDRMLTYLQMKYK